MKIRPVILCGGSGTRLWPVSRKHYPKQFAELLGQYSLLSTTLALIDEALEFLPFMIVAQCDHKFFVLDAVAQAKQKRATIVLEPCGRNTAAAALTAALADKDENILHLLMPSDHQINDHAAFFSAVAKAALAAQHNHIALFGITPDHPETGYGYIQCGEATEWPDIQTIKNYKEKPDAQTAQALIDEGALWNSGIFLYDPRVLLAEVARHAPEHIAFCREALAKSRIDLGCRELDSAAYAKLRNISFDNLVMENTTRGIVVPCEMGWSDAGSWESLWQMEPKNHDGNVLMGHTVTLDTKGSYIRSDGPVVGVIGLEDVAVIATVDAILVMPRSRSQDVKQLVSLLESGQRNVAAEHRRVMRPWGCYESVAEGNRFQVKHIRVKPQQSLSLQMHHHRAEHWIVVAGTAQVERDDEKQKVFENESIYIPKGTKHRLSNPGKIDLHLVEVQSGEYLGEDDIVRFSDNYGRVQAPTATIMNVKPVQVAEAITPLPYVRTRS